MGRREIGFAVVHALLWMAVGAGALFAADRLRGREPSLADLADEAAQRMETLGLTAEQEQALAAIRAQWRDEVVREEEEWQTRIAQHAADADRRIEALLTAEQARRWRDAGGGGGPR